MNFYARALAISCTIFALTACGTTVVPQLSDSTPTLDAQSVKPTKPVKPILASDIFYRSYRTTLQQNGRTLIGYLSVGGATDPQHGNRIVSSFTPSSYSFEQFIQATPAQIALWQPFVFECCTYYSNYYYNLPAFVTVGANNSISLSIGNPEPNSLNNGVVQFQLQGTIKAIEQIPLQIGQTTASPRIVGNAGASGGITWNAL